MKSLHLYLIVVNQQLKQIKYEILNYWIMLKLEINKQVIKCYAGYFDTQFGTCFIYINPNIHSYIYFETKDDNCLINYENEEKTKELYETIKNI